MYFYARSMRRNLVKRYRRSGGWVLLFAVVFCACREHSGEVPPTHEWLVEVGGRYLTRTELEQQMPPNLSRNDSAAFADAYVRQWIGNELLYENAEKNIPDLKRIDRMVEQYRRQLIMFEYQKQLINERLVKEISDSVIEQYYEQHKPDFKLNNGIVKGLFLKIPEDAPQVEQVRRWYRSDAPDAIEKIEKYSLKHAVGYEYFYDKWVSFNDVMDNIPYQVLSESDFLRNNKYLEVKENGFWYFLNIREYLTKGATEPLDFARSQIQEILINKRKMQFMTDIEEDLFRTALRKKKIKYYQWHGPDRDIENAGKNDSVQIGK